MVSATKATAGVPGSATFAGDNRCPLGKNAIAQRCPNPWAMPFFTTAVSLGFQELENFCGFRRNGFSHSRENDLAVRPVEILSLVCRPGVLPSKASVLQRPSFRFFVDFSYGLSFSHDFGFQLLWASNCLRDCLSPQRLLVRLQDWVSEGIWDIDNFSKFIDSRDLRFATSRSPRGRDPVHVHVRRQAEHAGGLPAETLRLPFC
jgi:hypothetical protein